MQETKTDKARNKRSKKLSEETRKLTDERERLNKTVDKSLQQKVKRAKGRKLVRKKIAIMKKSSALL